MGAVSDTVYEFCGMVYPDEHKQNKLFDELFAISPSNETINPVTIEEFRKFYERTGKWPHIGMDDLATIMGRKENMTSSARSDVANVIISAVEDIAAPGSSEEKKIIAADAIYEAIRKVVREEIAKENPVYA